MTIASGASRFDTSDGRIIRLVRDAGSMTRGGLIEATGWARSTVTRRVDALAERGLLAVDGEAESSGGRRAALLRFNGDAGRIIAADLGITHSRFATVNLLGRPVNDPSHLELDLSPGPDEIMPRIVETLRRHVDESDVRPLAIVVGLPAPIDARTGRPTNPPILSAWHDHPIIDRITAELSLPTLLEKDVNLMAVGEQRQSWPAATSLVFVKVGTGIGSGIVLDGELYRGATGSAGDIGHIQLDGYTGTLCRCGRYGCLEAVAGGGALATRMRALGRTVDDTRGISALVRSGDPEARAIMREAGQLIGQVLSTVVSFANPEVIVLGGDLGVEPLLIGAARAEIVKRPLELASKDLTFVATTLAEDAGIRGAAALSIDRLWPSA